MSEALYNRYRPQTLEEVIDQPAAQSLILAVANDQVPHAMIFAGPAGTGKTSTARALAAALNIRTHDYMEVDAATNRGIDDVRAIRDGAILQPFGEAKMYVLDEAHQLTPQAWPVLLKLLEEPPPHAYFVLVTTEAGKIPATVASRCTTYAFGTVSRQAIDDILTRVAIEQTGKDHAGACMTLSSASGGNVRSALVMLEQYLLQRGSMTAAAALEAVVTKQDSASLLLIAAMTGDHETIIGTISTLHSEGADFSRLIAGLAECVRVRMVEAVVTGSPGETDLLFPLADRLARAADIAAGAGNARLAVEATLLRTALEA